LLTFTAQLKNKRLHINQILAVLLLCVFAIALTPWSALHHHDEGQEHCMENAKLCMHKVHVGTERHNCLICSAHFTQDLITPDVAFQINLESKVRVKNFILVSGSYVALISTSLRGPPIG